MKTLQLFVLILASLFVISFQTLAQHQADNWYFGNQAGISFSSNPPTILSDGQMTALEGCASISDKNTGVLLFYTNGITVWNSSHEVMKNGTGLNSGLSSTQSSLIVPDPSNNLQYYIFTAPDLTGYTVTTALYYSLVSLQDPKGEVVSKNNFLIDSIAEKQAGTIHCNGKEFWVVTHHRNKALFYSFLVTSSGVRNIPVVSSYEPEKNFFIPGYLKISPDHSKIALVSSEKISDYKYTSCISLFNFNSKTGEVTGYKNLNRDNQDIGQLYGVSFSPDNTKLYTSDCANSSIYQYEVNLPDALSIRNSLVVLSDDNTCTAALQIAPNGKMYSAQLTSFLNHNQYVGVINNPNLKGINCDYHSDAIKLPSTCSTGLPNYMDYIFNSEGMDTLLNCTSPKAITSGNSNCLGQPVIFVDRSILNPTSRLWTFEDGTPASSTDSIVTVTYSQPGTHNVRLIVTNDNGSDTTYTVAAIFPVPTANAGDDRIICARQHIQIGEPAVAGYSYLWSPVNGLDNFSVSNPNASPDSTTTYKVLVSNDHCVDSDYVTVTVVQPPIAKAGNDTIICSGETVSIGAPSIPGNSYRWSPTTGLSSPNAAQTLATPNITTSYILNVVNSNGCITEDTVLVGVFSPVDGVFSLNPYVIKILPGEQFQTALHIPEDVQDWMVNLEYDASIMKFNSILSTATGIIAKVSNEQNGKVAVKGSGNGGDVVLEFKTFLPYSLDSVFTITMTVDSSQTTSCVSSSTRGNTIEMGEYCSKKLRRVSITGKYYFLSTKNNKINFGIGLPGKVLLELYDYTGTLKEVLTDSEFDAGEYSIDLDLPTGVYFCRIRSGLYQDIKKGVIVH